MSSNPGVTTSISIKKSSLKSDATFEIYKKKLTGNMTGLTEFYSQQKKIEDQSASNWTWNKIFIDQNEKFIYFVFCGDSCKHNNWLWQKRGCIIG